MRLHGSGTSKPTTARTPSFMITALDPKLTPAERSEITKLIVALEERHGLERAAMLLAWAATAAATVVEFERGKSSVPTGGS